MINSASEWFVLNLTDEKWNLEKYAKEEQR